MMSARAHPDSFHLPAGVLALLVHGAFFALLYLGINWRVEAPQGMVVDIWQSLPEPAALQEKIAPPPSPPPPTPAEPAKPLPPPKPAQTDIVPDKKALKAKRAEQVKRAQMEQEKLAQLERDKQLQIEKEKQAQAQAERDRQEQLKKEKLAQAEREKQAQLEREKLQAERVKQVQAERERQTQLERDKQVQATREQQAQIQAERQAQLDRDKQAQAEQAAAVGKVMAEYIGKIQTKIRRNIVLPPGVPDNAKAVFDVTLLPGGAVLSARLSAPSGSGPYDSAVERAILKAHTLPVPPDPALFNRFRELRLTFCPKEELCK